MDKFENNCTIYSKKYIESSIFPPIFVCKSNAIVSISCGVVLYKKKDLVVWEGQIWG